MKVNKWIKLSNYSKTIINVNEKHSAFYRWKKKLVKKSKLLWNNKDLQNVTLKGMGSLEFDDENKAIKLSLNDDVENLITRPNVSIIINLEENDYTEYNRIHLLIKPESVGFVNFYMHFSFGNDEQRIVHTSSVIPNIWNDIIFELDNQKLDNVKTINITPFLFGTPPEALPDVVFLIKDIKIEKVEMDDVKGWNLNNRLAYSHVGYFTNLEKQAIFQNKLVQKFYIKNKDKEIKFEGYSKEVKTNLGVFQIIDFSSLKIEGEYYIEVGNIKSEMFNIDDNPYLLSIWKSLQFLRTLRCGTEVKGVHSPCHLNCRTMHKDGRSVPCFGGWHDAGDVSQFEICTAEMADAIIELAKTVKDDKNLYNRLLEEAKVGIDWLLQTTFEDGNRSLAVVYKMWRKNILYPSNVGVYQNVSENGPFENLLSCSALLNAYTIFDDEIYKSWCLRISKIDFEQGIKGYNEGLYTKRWGPNIDCLVGGIASLCACKLFKITNDEKYQDIAIYFGDIIMKCQETLMPNWDIPLRGFFYEDVNHKYLLTFEHRGHEQTPIQGLVSLCETFKDHVNYKAWLNSLNLYKEYIIKTLKYTAPYNILCAHVYDLEKINLSRYTIPSNVSKEDALNELQNQIKHGIKLGNSVYLRIFPVAYSRRGFHATLLSKTKAVSLIANALNDQELKQIVVNQLEWVMGKNPFSSSTMYGEGYNYHPLYVAYSPQLVGSLPVGIKTLGDDDEPYWPTVNNAVYKEVWGHTTGKYLAVLSDIIKKLV